MLKISTDIPKEYIADTSLRFIHSLIYTKLFTNMNVYLQYCIRGKYNNNIKNIITSDEIETMFDKSLMTISYADIRELGKQHIPENGYDVEKNKKIATYLISTPGTLIFEILSIVADILQSALLEYARQNIEHQPMVLNVYLRRRIYFINSFINSETLFKYMFLNSYDNVFISYLTSNREKIIDTFMFLNDYKVNEKQFNDDIANMNVELEDIRDKENKNIIISCKFCGTYNVKFSKSQVRAADESQTYQVECLECFQRFSFTP